MTNIAVIEGAGPLVLSMPHSGRAIPPAIARRLTPEGLGVPDTDWWIERLYDFAAALDASVVRTDVSRYVIDVNRDPSGRSLYPGQATTALSPLETFDGAPLYRAGEEPDAAEIAERRQAYFEPYHGALVAAIQRAQARHGLALLYDCHSIRSAIPRLFAGTLPVFNLGTADGQSCAPSIEAAVAAAMRSVGLGYDWVVNGRFKGGWITRRYGRPQAGVHALQMELAQRAYMLECPPWTFDEPRAATLKRALRQILAALIASAAKPEVVR